MFKIKTIVVATFILISQQLYAAQSVEEIIKGRKAMFSENYQNAKKISILLKSNKIEEAKPLMKKISDNYKKLLNKAAQANGRKETVSYLNRAAKIKSKLYSTSKVNCFRCNGAGFLRISLDETKTCLSCFGKGFLVKEIQQL